MRMGRMLMSMGRRLSVLASGCLMLQMGGCAFDTANLASGLLTSIGSTLISNLVFGAFNLPTSF